MKTIFSSLFLTALFLLTVASLSGQCLTGPGVPNITGNVSFGPPINWANPNRVEISDDDYARVRMNAGETSKYLEVKDFMFLIPPASTILGISVLVECQQETDAFYKAESVRLMKDGVITGDDKAGLVVIPDGMDQSNMLGGMGDLWGEAWTAADIMDPDFGLVVSVSRTGGDPNLECLIDYIQIIIYYDDGTGCILPVTLGGLEAKSVASNTVQVSWSTTAEVQNDFFSVQRSTDNEHFETIGTVTGSGTTTHSVDYTFTDHQATGGDLYYRIRQTDLSGNLAYSHVVKVSPENSGVSFTAGPNPATEWIDLFFSQPAEGVTVELFSLSGQQLQSLHPADGSETIRLDVSSLPEGFYMVRMTDAEGHVSTLKNIVN